MESLVVNVLIGFWLVAFGAMALFPFLSASGEPRRAARAPQRDDQIISIHPVRPTQRWTTAESSPALATAPEGPVDGPHHRRAA